MGNVAMIRRIFFTLTLLVICGWSEAQNGLFGSWSEAQNGFFGGQIQPRRSPSAEEDRLFQGKGNAPRSSGGPMCPALTGCSLNCPNGRMKDAVGCEMCRCKVCDPNPCTSAFGAGIFIACSYGYARGEDGCMICYCNDPCRGYLCPPGQDCQVVKEVTSDTYSAKCVQRVTRPPCQPVNCVTRCRYGSKADNNGCATCICRDPCEERRCGINERCVIDPCLEANNCRDFGTYCVPTTVTRPPCRPVSCVPRCRYGSKADNNGCATCICRDPCEGNRCGINERCVIDPCLEANNCRDFGTYCVPKEQPAILALNNWMPRTTQTPARRPWGWVIPLFMQTVKSTKWGWEWGIPRTTPAMTVERLRELRGRPICPSLSGCTQKCSNGRMLNSDGCEMCQCKPCDPDPCPLNICFYGKLRDSGGCITCKCNDPCSVVSCPERNEGCKVVKDVATNTYSGKCVQIIVVPTCPLPLFHVCSNPCPHGYGVDVYGCQTCNCWDPCEGQLCRTNERCVVDQCTQTRTCRDYGYYCLANDQSGRTVSPIMPQTTTIAPETRLQAAMRQCCSTVRLSGSCYMTCATNSARLFTEYTTCFPNPKIWEYVNCISVAQANSTLRKPFNMLGSGNERNDFRRLRRNQPIEQSENQPTKKPGKASTTKNSQSRSTEKSDKVGDSPSMRNQTWPEVVGMKFKGAEKLILSKSPEVFVEFVEDGADSNEPDAFVPFRVKLFIDDKGVVARVPKNG